VVAVDSKTKGINKMRNKKYFCFIVVFNTFEDHASSKAAT